MPSRWVKSLVLIVGSWGAVCLTGCAGTGERAVMPGDHHARHGDEIVIAGQMFHTGAPVVLWTDPDGYDAYRTTPRFRKPPEGGWTEKARYNVRASELSESELARVSAGGWDLPLVQRVVDQFVIHYDVSGSSKVCFKTLQDDRNLSVHFMLDIDGTIYQTLDVKERAWHAGIANSRSVGIEIAHRGAYPPGKTGPMDEFYAEDDQGMFIEYPSRYGDPGTRTSGFVGRPAREGLILGTINGSELVQYDFTDEQYESLIKLTATLGAALPNLAMDYPRDGDGAVLPDALSREELDAFSGLIAHWHVTTGKIDPGPAFDWDRVIDGARSILEDRQTRGIFDPHAPMRRRQSDFSQGQASGAPEI